MFCVCNGFIGEEQYHCVSIHKRSANVLEFQVGSNTIHQSWLDENGATIDSYGGLESICSDQNFDKAHFITQARLDSTFELSPCPIDGEFVGLIPDAEDLCARLWSECDKNDTMNYQVSICGHDEIYDGMLNNSQWIILYSHLECQFSYKIAFFHLERRYQCIGQWTENNIIYTYAKRLDVPTYECFLGALASSDEIFIKEAGEHCRRDIDPYRYSMQLNKTNACPKVETKLEPPISHEYSEKVPSTHTTDEPSQPNAEVEYEYFEENHLNMNGNVASSTETKVQPKNDPNNVEEGTNELYHPIHPKLDITITTKPDNTSESHSHSIPTQSNHILLFALVPLGALMSGLLWVVNWLACISLQLNCLFNVCDKRTPSY